MPNLDNIDPTFVNDLLESKSSIWTAAQILNNIGLTVTIPPTNIRPNPEQRMDYSDNGDLVLNLRVEVKRRNLHFTSTQDYPFPTIIVDVCHKYNNPQTKPLFYLIFNQTMTHIAIIHCATTEQYWTTRTINTPVRGPRDRDYYECPKEHIKIVPVEALVFRDLFFPNSAEFDITL